MAISATKVTLKIGGVQIPEVTISSGLSLPYSDKGKSIEVVSVVGSGSAVSTGAEYTGSVADGSVVAAGNLTITVTDNAEPPVSGTVTLAITLQEGAGVPGTLTYPGWFKFRRLPMNVKYVTDGITLDGVKEVLGVQSGKVVAFEFDEATQKLKLYTATSNAQVGNNTVLEIVLLVLEQ